MIIKVQLSIVTNATERQMLIYDENRDFVYEGPATPEIIEMLEPKDGSYKFQKAYFNADMIDDPNKKGAKRFFITSWADPQNW